jgi:hypothetical protein
MIARLWLRSMTFRVLVGMAGQLPFLLAAPYALFGHPHDPLSGLSGLGGAIGMPLAARLREPEYWQLDKKARRRVCEVQLTAQPSGDRQLDSIAVGRLRASADKEKLGRTAPRVALLVMIATPVVAALRTGNGWWLIAALPLALCLAGWLRARPRSTAQARLDRLVDRMGESSARGRPSCG